jgi:arylsulfatase
LDKKILANQKSHKQNYGNEGRELMKPNILLIMSDQMRYDAIGANGNAKIQTPHLDRLARESVHFTNAYTPNPICVPARASLTTGCYPHKCTGVKSNAGAIKAGFPLLGVELRNRGYQTYAMGKLHYLPYMPTPEERVTHGIDTVELYESGRILKEFDPYLTRGGLEDYYDYLKTVGWHGYTRANGMGNNDVYAVTSAIPEEHYVDTWVADRALYYMRRHLEDAPDRPFFMWASFPKPHSAFDPPRPYDSLYDPREMDDPVGGIVDLKEQGIDNSYAEYLRLMWDKLSLQAKKQIKANYYGLISLQDKQIGRLLQFLQDNGLEEQTIVVYTADHGEMLGDKGIYFKRIFYDPAVHLPLFIKYPLRLTRSFRTNCLAGLQDILPTLCSLMGRPLDREVDGQDLTPVLTRNEKVRDYYVSQCNTSDPSRPENQIYMIIDGVWKYLYTVYGGIEELYDRRADVRELHNIAANLPFKTAEFRNLLLQWCRENGDLEMLTDGGLTKTAQKPREIVRPANPFGRRFY